MSEIRITISAPELADAIKELAAALSAFREDRPAAGREAIGQSAERGQTAAEQIANPQNAIAEPTAEESAAPKYTLEMLAKAGTALVDAGKMDELIALLGKYQVEALTALRPQQYKDFADDLRSIGAQI